ncbi:class F sortase [Salinicoccus albus]|uniref:class F sortase n=1 Tax=Salinicoccus albus TaxID=418756 RepID=UPI00036A065B|nr:class F sortase [Salinicoccus albus]
MQKLLMLIMMMALLLVGCGGEDTETADENVASETESTEASSESPEDTGKVKPTASASEENSQSNTSSESVEILKDEREGIIPERIEIPAIDVDAPTQHLGQLDNGEMAVPDTLHEAAWYEPGYKVGAPGNSVIAGHVDDTVNPGVFSQLHTLEAGDEIIVHGEDGTSLTFTVYDKELFDADSAPVDKIFGYSHNSLLNLITCEGPYDYEAGGTPNRWVIYTELNTDV